MAATFIVETGTGLSNANSYLSITDADAYHLDHSGSTDWSGADNADKEAALRLATQYLDAKHAGKWKGTKYTTTQALAWPRTGAYDGENCLIEYNVIPQALKDACAELALKVIGGDTLLDDLDKTGVIKSETKKLGILETSKEYIGGKSQVKRYPLIELLVKQLTTDNSVCERG